VVKSNSVYTMTLDECAELVGAVIAYSSFDDPEYKGPQERIIILWNGRLHEFNHIQRAKHYLLYVAGELDAE
jgi:hypothetical protein